MQDDIKGLKGVYTIKHIRDGEVLQEWEIPNGITTEGKNALLDIMFGGGTQVTTWYFGLIDNASYSALASGDTHASHAGWIENTDYDESTREAWVEAAASAGSMGTTTSAEFTMNSTVTIKGIFLASISTKGSVSGSATLWSTVLFAAGVAVIATDVISVDYTVSVS